MPDQTITPESALANWRQWQVSLPCEPEIVCSLGQGLSNQSYLVQSGETHMVLRINSCDTRLHGIDRQREATIWQAAFGSGIAPRLVHAENRYLVSEYIANETVELKQDGDGLADEVFRLLEKCHQIPIDTLPIDYGQHIDSYWAKIDSSLNDQAGCHNSDMGFRDSPVVATLLEQRKPMQQALQSLIDRQKEAVLCHHDPVKANFVGSPERLYLIDWEYAAKGLAVMDYAAVAAEWGFSDDLISSRLQVCPDSLDIAKKLYRYMCRLWEVTQNRNN